jgi:hypothetical protein
MYAIAIDGELFATLPNKAQVIEKLRAKELREKLAEDVKLELASFDSERRKWIPLCLSEFAHAA